MTAIQEIDLESEIINKKKQFIFQVIQSANSVLPNQKYTYYIYIKNVSGLLAENVHIKMVHPTSIIVDEPDTNDFIPIGDLKDGHSHLLKLSARCTLTGVHTAHFICYSDLSGMFYQSLEIHCGYQKYVPELHHRVSIYNFSPYEDTYEIGIKDYSDKVTQQFKHQKLPYQAGESLFNPIDDYRNESQNYLDQLDVLKNQDEHGYQYIGRDDFAIDAIESFEGDNLVEILTEINRHSQYVRSTYIRTGNNELNNEFKEFKPDGFFNRFGLLNSEIYHNVGVLPTYNYMNEYLFRWAPTSEQPLNLYPTKKAMIWGQKIWAGEGYNVYEHYDDDKNNIHRHRKLGFFREKHIAEEYISKKKQFNIDHFQKNYSYSIEEIYRTPGVFLINIPISKIPSNFFLLNQPEIEKIVERAKPFGMRGLPRYMIDISFNHHLEYNAYPIIKPLVPIDLGEYGKIIYWIQSLKYEKVVETVCGVRMESYQLKPNGLGVYNGCNWEYDYNFKRNALPKVVNAKGRNKDNALKIDLDPEYNIVSCKNDNNLATTAQIAELLYLNNYDTISFSQTKYSQGLRTFSQFKDPQKDVPQENVLYTLEFKQPDGSIKTFDVIGIPPDNFTLWLSALKTSSNHVKFNLKKEGNTYYINKSGPQLNKIDFIKLPISQISKDNVEVGIFFKDAYFKIHGLSAEYDSFLQKHYMKYSSSKNNNYKVNKEGYENIVSLALKILPYNNENIVIMYFEHETGNETRQLSYFNHIIIPDLKEIGVFIRNGSSEGIPLHSWYTLPLYGYNEEAEIVKDKNVKRIERKSSVVFNTPQYQDYKIYDNYDIQTKSNGKEWTNLYRIDRAENSYSYIKNNTNDIVSPDDIILYIDDLEIPEQSIVKNIKVKGIMESLSNKTYCLGSYATQTNSLNKNVPNSIASFEPHDIRCYHHAKESHDYYKLKKENAEANDNTREIKYYSKLLNDNIVFDNALNLSLDYLSTDNSYMEIKKPFWYELFDFTIKPYASQDIKKIYFVIEGYNDGSTTQLLSQLTHYNDFATKIPTEIETGYFYKKIPLPNDLNYLLDDIYLRFRFQDLNHSVKIFNTHIDVDFANKTPENYEYNDTEEKDFGEKKIVNINIIDQDTYPYHLNNGLAIKLSFDDMHPGDEYRIYSVEIDVLYQKLSTNMLINSDRYKTTKKSKYTTVTGQESETFLSGQFYDDKPIIIQDLSNHVVQDNGFELSNKIYQSFEAKSDNITSIEIFPNGFYGSPDTNLKIKLYENSGTTPGKLIKEVNATGWVKSNEKLKYLDRIKYNIPINNLKIGNVYWFSFEVVHPNKNSGYYLEYTNETIKNHKLIYEEDNDLRNGFACLKFNIYTANIINGFNHIPTTQTYFVDPYISIGLNRGQGYISDLRVQKSGE